MNQAVNCGYAARSTKMNRPPVRAVMLKRMTVTLVTSLANRSYRRSCFRYPSHSEITTKIGAPRMKAPNNVCSWATIQTAVRFPV